MKDFTLYDNTITSDFIAVVGKTFYKLRYGIGATIPANIKGNLAMVRKELLDWQLLPGTDKTLFADPVIYPSECNRGASNYLCELPGQRYAIICQSLNNLNNMNQSTPAFEFSVVNNTTANISVRYFNSSAPGTTLGTPVTLVPNEVLLLASSSVPLGANQIGITGTGQVNETLSYHTSTSTATFAYNANLNFGTEIVIPTSLFIGNMSVVFEPYVTPSTGPASELSIGNNTPNDMTVFFFNSSNPGTPIGNPFDLEPYAALLIPLSDMPQGADQIGFEGTGQVNFTVVYHTDANDITLIPITNQDLGGGSLSLPTSIITGNTSVIFESYVVPVSEMSIANNTAETLTASFISTDNPGTSYGSPITIGPGTAALILSTDIPAGANQLSISGNATINYTMVYHSDPGDLQISSSINVSLSFSGFYMFLSTFTGNMSIDIQDYAVPIENFFEIINLSADNMQILDYSGNALDITDAYGNLFSEMLAPGAVLKLTTSEMVNFTPPPATEPQPITGFQFALYPGNDYIAYNKPAGTTSGLSPFSFNTSFSLDIVDPLTSDSAMIMILSAPISK